MVTLLTPKLQKNFFSPCIRMSEKNLNCGDKKKKIKKSDFYKNKKITKIDQIDVNGILVSKEEPYVQKIHLNTSSDTMIMMLLGHYA